VTYSKWRRLGSLQLNTTLFYNTSVNIKDTDRRKLANYFNFSFA
jgi:hypothetical protein